uniref:Uncharacterized protein n=1 Tax=Myoviridae sp. ctu2j3 TaxID=2825197 RepID=A0A8S5UI73_9CAUD|nr:MAG TPA: hypothetical protein [Myoviridae sp. ctu2j3]DAF94305.1 MAG TPA: hypothetical protein [Myoviridae sp. ctu2j3]
MHDGIAHAAQSGYLHSFCSVSARVNVQSRRCLVDLVLGK